jgi:mono/diheme cytochrome c family protein
MPARTPFPLLAATLVPATAAADKVTFDDHVLPLFQQACLNCHNPDQTKGGLDLSTFATTLKGGSGGPVVAPNDPGSRLLALVTGSAEPNMPPKGDPLAKDQIAVIKAWIEGGLLENPASAGREFDTVLAAEFHTLRAHQARITALAFRSDSSVLASASEDGTVRFWEMSGGSEIRKLN